MPLMGASAQATAPRAPAAAARRLRRAPPQASATPTDWLREAHQAMLDAVLGGEGLAGVAEIAAEGARSPLAVIVPSLGSAIVARGCVAPLEPLRLRRWASERVQGRQAALPPEVRSATPVRLLGEIVGMVVLLAGAEEPHPRAAEFLHAAAAATVSAIAIENAKEDLRQSLRGSFLEELRSRTDLDAAEIVRRAGRLGCDLSRGAVILCAELLNDLPRLVLATIAEEHPGSLAQQLDDSASHSRARIYAALPPPGPTDTADTTLACARRIATRLRRYGIIGVSSFYADPAALPSGMQEAELVVDVVHFSGAATADELGSGTYKLLLRVLASHPEEVQSFYESTIAPIVRYDEQYGTELVRTLHAYLDANCNMNATASAIFAHRHTIAYRLDRIRELTGLDPMISEHRERLGLSLKVHHLVAPRLPR